MGKTRKVALIRGGFERLVGAEVEEDNAVAQWFVDSDETLGKSKGEDGKEEEYEFSRV